MTGIMATTFTHSTRRLARGSMALLLPGLVCWFLGNGLWIQAKAILAQHLISSAWQNSLEQGEPVKPWPWADTWPVASMTDHRSGRVFYILSGAQGNSLAFGPGNLHGSASPGTPGVSIVGGHRDTHFRFLKSSLPGDMLTVVNHQGNSSRWRIQGAAIHNIHQQQLLADADDQLILVTCYPFDALQSGGPLRYVVRAHRMPDSSG